MRLTLLLLLIATGIFILGLKVTGDSPITGVNGEGYFLNTTAGTITALGESSVDGEDYELVATTTGGTLVWADSTSTCIAAGLC